MKLSLETVRLLASLGDPEAVAAYWTARALRVEERGAWTATTRSGALWPAPRQVAA